MHDTYTANLILLDLISLIIFGRLLWAKVVLINILKHIILEAFQSHSQLYRIIWNYVRS
jgi:hypothetical protein